MTVMLVLFVVVSEAINRNVLHLPKVSPFVPILFDISDGNIDKDPTHSQNLI